MKAYLQQLCATADTPLIAQNLVREYLQARILQSLQRAGAMQTLAFHGAILSTTSLKRHVALNLQHHDRASLFAGKLHAVLQRVYPKGRDFFDLWWYLSQPEWPEPNLNQLNNALIQSGWTGSVLNPSNWRDYVRQRIEQLDWQEDVAQDIRAFIIGSDWFKQLSKESLRTLLEGPCTR